MIPTYAFTLFQLTMVLPVIFSVNDPMSNALAITKIINKINTTVKMETQSKFEMLNSFGASITSLAANANKGVSTVNNSTNVFLINELFKTLRVLNFIFKD